MMNHAQLLTALETNLEILTDLVSFLDDTQAATRIGRNWTIHEHLAHLVMAHRVLLARTEDFLAQPTPTITPYSPTESQAGTPVFSESLRTFATLRKRQVELLRAADEAAWTKRADHPEYQSPYSLLDLVRHMVLHDGFHLYRIEELALLKPACVSEL